MLSVLACLLPMTGCMDDNVVSSATSGRCAVTAVALGGMHVRVNTVTASGNDTSYLTTLSGNYTPMQIDQHALRIYNRDSLPIGTIVSRVAFSSFSADGVLALRTLAGTDTLFSTSDSIDCSQPRTFVVYATDGTSKKEYTLTLNVHQQEGNEFTWGRTVAALSDLASLVKPKAVALDNGVLGVYGLQGSDPVLLKATTSEADEWTTVSLTGDVAGFEPRSVTEVGGRFYANGDAGLIMSADGLAWSAVAGGMPVVAASTDSLFAIQGGAFFSSADGTNWVRNAHEADGILPTSAYAAVCTPSTMYETYEDLLLTGTHEGDVVVWKRNLDRRNYNTYPWIYYTPTEENTLTLPLMTSTTLVPYDDKVLAFGLSAAGELETYISSDGGRTWKDEASGYTFPVVSTPADISAVSDTEGFLWIVCSGSGEVWRGRLNRMSWSEDDGAFERNVVQ